MFNSLKSKFVFSFVVLQLFFFIIIVSMNFTSIDKASETLTREKISVTSQLLVELLKTPMIVFDLATIDNVVENFSTMENAIGIQIEDPNHVEFSSHLKTGTIPKQLFDEVILKGDQTITYEKKKYIFSSINVVVENKKIGHIHFAFDATQRFENIKTNKELTYVIVFIAFVLGLVVAFIIGNNLGKSLKLLTKISKDIAQDKKVDIPKNVTLSNEMEELFQSVDLMQDLIFERTQKLNKSIELFGANVIASSSDTSGKITYASQALCDISGYTQEELMGQPHSILRHDDMPSELFKELWKTIKSGKPWSGEIKNRKKDGGYFWVSASIVPEFNHKYNILGYTSIKHDITAQKVKEEFMANMSHELRTPLNAIIGFSEILNKKLTSDEELSLLGHISYSSKSLLSLINSILDLSKIQDSKFTIELYNFNAYDEIVESCEHVQGLMSHKNIKLDKKINENLKVILLGDWHRINQIILNIISNSIKFTEKNGLITFEASYQDNNLVLSISDNGVGMNKKVQDRIFEPFEQADGSTTRKYGGTGLGLSITQSLVELMQGKIELESKEGVGTTFTVFIPLEKVQLSIDKTISVREHKKKILSGHILVAEDNRTNQLLIKMLLEEFGLTCDIANDGIEAVEMYEPNKYKLILMDENMPRMNGIEAMKTLHEKYKDKCGPIIALTANAMAKDKDRFLNVGMDDYIPKPIDNDELYTVLKGFL